MTKLDSVILSILLSIVISVGSVSSSVAADSCDSVGITYVNALKSYQSNPNPTNDQYKELASLRKVADAQIKDCIKIINQDFKNSLKAINDKFPSYSKSKDAKLSQSTSKNSQIASAIVIRDERIKALSTLPVLPPKPAKPINQKKNNR